VPICGAELSLKTISKPKSGLAKVRNQGNKMDLSMLDYIIVIGLLIVAGLIVAYCGLGVDAKQIDDLDKVFKNKKRK
jgi:hypothetical protein